MKRIAFASLALAAAFTIGPNAAPAQHAGHHLESKSSGPAMPYAGQDLQKITSLSDAEVSDLLAGKGMGLAKPAELNGYPGPAHVLEHAEKLELTADQRSAVQAAFDKMATRAKAAGAKYVAAEQALDDLLRAGNPEPAAVSARLAAADAARAETRMAHIAAHLEITPLLTTQQRQLYAELRGYRDGQAPVDKKH